MRIAVLHPGEMGVSLARALADAGHNVGWVEAGRSQATRERAQGYHPLAGLDDLVTWAEGIVSVCPPGAAFGLAEQVKHTGFTGLYVDANAVAPQTATRIAGLFGASYVDGGIIGPPADQPGSTRLYLSGQKAGEVESWFTGSMVDARVVGAQVAQASALKMAYAAYTKGNSALLLAVAALAEAAGVRDELEAEWQLSQPGLLDRSRKAARGTSRKAWRFVGEMDEIAATFGAFDLPDGFHQGASEVYQRMASLRDLPPADLEAVLEQLLSDRS